MVLGLSVYAPLLLPALEEFARAGGGGSGSGGGAGGAIVFIAMAGYFPMYGLGRLLRLGRNKPTWVALQVVGWIVASALAIALLASLLVLPSLLYALYVAIPIAAGSLLGIGAGLYSWFSTLRQSQKVYNALRHAEQTDYAWNEKRLQKYAEGIFYKFQQDWSKSDLESMRRYLNPKYHAHITLMVQALSEARRVNKVINPKIKQSNIVQAVDSVDNSQDTFTLGITASADDQLIDTRDNVLFYADRSSFTEYWVFRRDGNNWLLEAINQATATSSKDRKDIRAFADTSGGYYAQDWGWLLLPRVGYLFSKNGKFGISDINNHVIRKVDDSIVQLYTYDPYPSSKYQTADPYIIAQTTVPKTYGQILVRRRSKLVNWPVQGLTKMSMEWGEFNNMYDVYASDLERATSFELLHPGFMVLLRDLPFEVNIEVVDNVVYLFVKSATSKDTYAKLYDILMKARKEMER